MRVTKEIEDGGKKKQTSTYIRNRKMVSSKQSDTEHGLQRQDGTDLTARNEKIKQGRQKWNRMDQKGAVL